MGFFDKEVFETHGVLTSNGIQKRFLEAVGRRQKVEMVSEYLLLDDDDINVYKNLTTRSINVHINSINDNINPQSIAKHSKEKNSKEQHTTESKKVVVDDAPKMNEMIDKDFARITRFYQENIGPLVPHIGEELGYMIDAHPVELILESLKRALEANATNKVRYANSILVNWKNQLLKTLDDVKAADQRRANSLPNKKYAKTEMVPDWFGKEDKPTSPVEEDLDIAAERERLRQELTGGK